MTRYEQLETKALALLSAANKAGNFEISRVWYHKHVELMDAIKSLSIDEAIKEV